MSTKSFRIINMRRVFPSQAETRIVQIPLEPIIEAGSPEKALIEAGALYPALKPNLAIIPWTPKFPSN